MLALAQTTKAEIVDRIVATVGDIPITQFEVESFNPEQLRKIKAIEDDDRRQESLTRYYRNTLNYLVDQYTVVVAAEKQGIVVSEADVEGALASVMEANNVNRAQLEEILEGEGLTMAKYLWQLKMEMVNQRLQNTVLRNMVVVTPEDVRKHIAANPAEYHVADSYEVRMVTVAGENEAKQVKKDLESGDDFAVVAEKYSPSAGAPGGGYLGWVDISAVSHDIARAIRPLKSGGVTEPVKSGELWQVFIVSGYRPFEDNIDQATMEDVRESIAADQYSKAFGVWLEKQRETILVDYHVDWM